MKIFEKMALRLYGLIRKTGLAGIFVSGEKLRRLQLQDDPGKLEQSRAVRDLSYMIMVIVVTLVLVLILLIKGAGQSKDDVLLRGEPGDGTTSYEMELRRDGKQSGKVEINVSEQQIGDEQLPQLFREAEEMVRTEMLGDNISLDAVSTSLEFVDSLPMGINVTWERDREKLFSENGRLRIRAGSEPAQVTVYATIEYHGYERRIPIIVTVIRTEDPDAEEGDEALERALAEADAANPKDKAYRLPSKAGDAELEWEAASDNRPVLLVLMGFLMAAMIIPAGKSAVNDRLKKRESQMKSDYPDIVSKLILLMSAGETCRGAWKKICNDYLGSLSSTGKRYAYEEMCFSLRELELGAAEAQVYERFGNRAGLVCYSRLATMLARNLKRGSRDILSQLELEAKDAFAERFDEVRKKGEEASTKLLLPMMGMLMIVVAIIVVPAFSGMG